MAMLPLIRITPNSHQHPVNTVVSPRRRRRRDRGRGRGCGGRCRGERVGFESGLISFHCYLIVCVYVFCMDVGVS